MSAPITALWRKTTTQPRPRRRFWRCRCFKFVRKHALQIFRAALEAADPYAAVLEHLQFDGRTLIAGQKRYKIDAFDHVQVIGAGKASAAMARAVERLLGRRIAGGAVIVPDGTVPKLRRIALTPAGHPIPDGRG